MLLRPLSRLARKGAQCVLPVAAVSGLRALSQRAQSTTKVAVSQFGRVRVQSQLPVVVAALDAPLKGGGGTGVSEILSEVIAEYPQLAVTENFTDG